MRFLSFLLVLAVLAGCQKDTRTTSAGALKPVDPRIETCSAGSTVKLSGEARVDLTKVLQGEGAVNGTVERQVETMISEAAGSALTGEQLIRAQENYLKCLRSEAELVSKNARPWQNYSKTQCTAFAACETNRMASVRICREEHQNAGRPYGACYTNLTQRLMGCYEVKSPDHLALARSFCEANHNV